MRQKRWIQISLILIIAGSIMLAVNQIVFVPRFIALRDATIAWSENHTGSTPPSPGEYGIDVSTFFISNTLSFGVLLIFVGAAYLVIILLAKMLNKDSIWPTK